MKAVCPSDPTHAQFVTTAHEVHDWLVDAQGGFLEDRGCTETTHRPYPGNGNAWTCAICGSLATHTQDH